jgi:hypothetical protein
MAKGLDFELGLWRLHIITVQVERPWNKVRGQRFEVWAWPLEASHYYRPSREAVRQSSWPKLRTLGLAFEDFTLYPAEDSNSYIHILLAIYFSAHDLFRLSTKVWPLNPTASRLGRPYIHWCSVKRPLCNPSRSEDWH